MKTGGKHSKETRDKIARALTGQVISPEIRRKISMGSMGKVMSAVAKNKISIANSGRVRSKELRKRISDTMIGKMPIRLQRDGSYGGIKRGHYDINGKDYFFRSGWEANYALYLDFLIKIKQIKSWEYEADVFVFDKIKFGTRSYRPDFKVLTDRDKIEYHEVKGWMDPQSKTKLNRMRIYYPDTKVIVIDGDAYSDIKGKVGQMLGFY